MGYLLVVFGAQGGLRVSKFKMQNHPLNQRILNCGLWILNLEF